MNKALFGIGAVVASLMAAPAKADDWSRPNSAWVTPAPVFGSIGTGYRGYSAIPYGVWPSNPSRHAFHSPRVSSHLNSNYPNYRGGVVPSPVRSWGMPYPYPRR
jgi:opacity protein-like surface antigen